MADRPFFNPAHNAWYLNGLSLEGFIILAPTFGNSLSSGFSVLFIVLVAWMAVARRRVMLLKCL